MNDELGLGKVTKEVFRRSVQPYLPVDEVELDGATVDLSGHTVIAHSPSIGVPLEALGFFAFHYAASNVASRFGKPTHIVAGIYMPLRTKERDLRVIVKAMGDEATRYGVKVAAGQTATYYGLEIPLLTATCLGEQLRKTQKLSPGDVVALIGEVGGEGVWLNDVSRGSERDVWRGFTPLHAILALQRSPHVKLMHDVSEGGVKGALYEVQDSYKVRLSINSHTLNYHEEIYSVSDDPLRAPSYGALVAVLDPEGVDEVERLCRENEFPFSVAGVVEDGMGLVVDGVEESMQRRVDLDEVYGSLQPTDSLISRLGSAIDRLVRIKGIEGYIPEVGTNMVYAREDSASADDVAGLSGRVVKTSAGALACGEVTYGASRFLASVVLEACRLNPRIRAAVNLKVSSGLVAWLKKARLRVATLPSESEGEGCPVTHFIRSNPVLLDAYVHPGGFGVEPTTTIIAESPERLVEIISEIAGDG